MAHGEDTVLCNGCGAEITWAPIIIKASHRVYSFCCVDCAQERPCTCGDRMLFDDERRTHKATIVDSFMPD